MKPMLTDTEKQQIPTSYVEDLRRQYFDATRPVPKKAIYHNGHWVFVVIAPKEARM